MALQNTFTPIDIIEQLLHPCLVSRDMSNYKIRHPPVHQAACIGRKDILLLFKNAYTDIMSQKNLIEWDGCNLAAMIYFEVHFHFINPEIFMTLLPTEQMDLNFLFVDVILHYLKEGKKYTEKGTLTVRERTAFWQKAKRIISQIIWKLPTSTVWESITLTGMFVISGRLKIIPQSADTAFVYKRGWIPLTSIDKLLDILPLCGYSVNQVEANTQKNVLEKFKTESQEKARSVRTGRFGLRNACIDSIRRSVHLSATKDDLDMIPKDLQKMVSGEEIVDLVIKTLQGMN